VVAVDLDCWMRKKVSDEKRENGKENEIIAWRD